MLDYDFVFYRNPLARRQKDEGGKRHDTQPPQLEKDKDDSLPDGRKGGRSILNDKPCHTNPRSCGEKSIDERHVSRSGAEREKEKGRSDEDGHDKTY